jgi:hypothetical protein
LPIVITDAVAGGLPPEAMSASRIANTADQFANHVIDLLRLTPAVRRGIARSSDLCELTWPRTLEPLWSILDRAASSAPRLQSAVAHIAWRSV